MNLLHSDVVNVVWRICMSQNHVIELSNTPKQRPVICDYAGGRFRLTAEGLTFIGIDKDGTPLPPRWICAPLYVVAKTRDSQSGEWGRLLEWQDDDGITHQWAMPLALLQGDASDVRRELARLGLSISPNRTARDLLASYLQVFPVDARARCVDKLGWHGDVYVTASQCIGQATEKIVFQNTNAIEPAVSVKGSVEEWRDSIGRLASGNSRLMFSISVALAPVLAKIVGENSGGFHFRGASSSGKSTALSLAASVWGNPQSYCRLWRSTTNGLEGLAALHNDGLLILDELSQIDPREAGEAAYLLANGQGKTRASRTGTVRQSSRWFLFFLSAGELASQFGLTGWQKGEAFHAAKVCFIAWQEAFGVDGKHEDRAIMAQVRAFFESLGASRIDNANSPNNDKILNRAGFYLTDDEGFRNLHGVNRSVQK